MSNGSIFQINVSQGGVPKRRVEHAVVTPRGLIGDAQIDLRAHGSPEQALCIYSVETIAVLRSEGHRVAAGSTGENITTQGLNWDAMLAGARLRLGAEVVIEVTGYASPCQRNARWFVGGNFNRINQAPHPGSSRVYARVIQPGTIHEGDTIEIEGDDAIDRVVRRQVPAARWPRDFA